MYYLNRKIIREVPEGDNIRLFLEPERWGPEGSQVVFQDEDFVLVHKDWRDDIVTESIVSDDEYSRIYNQVRVDPSVEQIVNILFENNVGLSDIKRILVGVEQTIKHFHDQQMNELFGNTEPLRTLAQIAKGKERFFNPKKKP